MSNFVNIKKAVLLPLLAFTVTANGWPLAPPPGLDFAATTRVERVQLLVDECWTDRDGRRHVNQEIFRAVRDLINRAESFLLLDMFLINNFGYTAVEGCYPLSDEFTGWLVAKKRDHPEIDIILISDPVNTIYGAVESPHFTALEQAGIKVVLTDLNKLPDSNPIYSTPWRLLARPFGTAPGFLMPNPLGEGRISVRSFLKLLNMKANHRKVVISEGELMVLSANPHSGSSAHWNTALHVAGAGMKMAWQTEAAILRFSHGGDIPSPVFEEKPGGRFQLEILTEERVRVRVLELLNTLEPGGRIDLSMFYLADQSILDALITAHQRGAYLRVILDPNKDAFGREKNGMPNRQSAALLSEYRIPVRWASTHGEQFHVKMIYVEQLSGDATLVTGSANYTRRNLGNYNAESCLAITGSVDSEIMAKQRATFQRWWNNQGERGYTLHYRVYADENILRRIGAWFQESSGLSSF
ncbi:MAG: phospholipase D-like domain-containing protein [Kiritimatiellae bacterium]|nr:phospholipase D-like domain-containing protein [Kiritimatiellia bacterium]